MLYLYEQIIGYLKRLFAFCKYNGIGWMWDERVMVQKLGLGGLSLMAVYFHGGVVQSFWFSCYFYFFYSLVRVLNYYIIYN